jgi:sugar phosphate isomerase/epimerase
LEKVLIENRLANRLGPTHKDPDYDERKKRVREELKRALGEVQEIKGDYDVRLGLDLHFDFILDIP